MSEGKVEVHTGAPSWHQARAGAISAGVVTFDTPAQADEYVTGFRARRPHEPVFVIDRRPDSGTATPGSDSKGEA